jgi:hypothetical protein
VDVRPRIASSRMTLVVIFISISSIYAFTASGHYKW